MITVWLKTILPISKVSLELLSLLSTLIEDNSNNRVLWHQFTSTYKVPVLIFALKNCNTCKNRGKLVLPVCMEHEQK